MSFISKLVGSSSKSRIPVNLAHLKCDLHSHFIPGIDDGAKSMDESVALLREFSALGYTKIITTPHVMSDAYRNTPEIILDGLSKLRIALELANVPIEIHAAAEYYLDYDFEKSIEEKKLLTFGKPASNTSLGNYVLFELAFINPPDSLMNVIFKLITNGYKPVLAHPERYSFWHHNFNKYEELIEKGVLFQLNINSLTGYYSPQVRTIAERMINQNMISFLGSDCHHAGHIELMKKVIYEKALHKLVEGGRLLNSKL
jgi:protein-tyrosine phosphatase